MAAKTLAYATGAAVVGLDSLEAVAHNARGCAPISVVADAQRGEVYTAEFTRPAYGEPLVTSRPSQIEPSRDWLARLEPGHARPGPGTGFAAHPGRRSGRAARRRFHSQLPRRGGADRNGPARPGQAAGATTSGCSSHGTCDRARPRNNGIRESSPVPVDHGRPSLICGRPHARRRSNPDQVGLWIAVEPVPDHPPRGRPRDVPQPDWPGGSRSRRQDRARCRLRHGAISADRGRIAGQAVRSAST